MIKRIFHLSIFIFTSSLAIGQTLSSQSKVIHGTVFFDSNKDGLISKGDKGLKDILVSNGVEVVKTDKKGNFQLLVNVGQSVFPILPNYLTLSKAEKSNILNVNFINIPSIDSLNKTASIDFGLVKQVVKNEFTFGAIGDVQVDNFEELDYASRSIFSELANRKDLSFNIFLGDLVNDKMELMKDFRQNLEQIPTVSLTLVGNHDRNTKNQNNFLSDFHANFGASNYAFNYGKVHFIVLNNVFSTRKNGYEGRISEEQLEFVKNDLSYLEKSTPVVICQHIPMRATKNRNELFEFLDGFHNVLILSGHTHTVSRHFYNNGKIHELVAGATSGTWWRGEKDLEGIPLSLMQCGTPRGYFLVSFKEDGFSFQYKGVGKDAQQQMHVALDSATLIANIYGASDSTLVEMQIDDAEWLPMQKSRIMDPLIASIISKNKEKVYPTLGSKALPVRARDSNHIWTIQLNDMIEKQFYKINIRAKDSHGFEVEQSHYLRY